MQLLFMVIKKVTGKANYFFFFFQNLIIRTSKKDCELTSVNFNVGFDQVRRIFYY